MKMLETIKENSLSFDSEDKITSGSPLGLSEGYSPNHETPTVFIRSRDDENPSGSKPMPTIDPTDLLGGDFFYLLKKVGRGIEPRLPEKL